MPEYNLYKKAKYVVVVSTNRIIYVCVTTRRNEDEIIQILVEKIKAHYYWIIKIQDGIEKTIYNNTLKQQS